MEEIKEANNESYLGETSEGIIMQIDTTWTNLTEQILQSTQAQKMSKIELEQLLNSERAPKIAKDLI